MKPIIPLFFAVICSLPLHGQESDIRISTEYGLSFTKLIQPEPRDEGYAPSLQMFLRNGFRLSPKLDLNIGIGYFQARHFLYQDFGGFQDLDYARTLRTHHYLAVPIGLRLNYGRLYISPEIAIARNISNTAVQTAYTTDGQSFRNLFDDEFNSRFNHVYIVPVMLSVGQDFSIGSIDLTAGLRMHYSLTPVASISDNRGHPFGIGMYTGIRI